MTTLTGYVASPALYREVGIEAQPGDQVEIYLDQVKVPGFPEFIVGTIQNPVTVVCGGTSYPIEYDEADLAGSGVEFIEGDDILSIVVVSEARVLFAAEEAAREAADDLLQDQIDECVRFTDQELTVTQALVVLNNMKLSNNGLTLFAKITDAPQVSNSTVFVNTDLTISIPCVGIWEITAIVPLTPLFTVGGVSGGAKFRLSTSGLVASDQSIAVTGTIIKTDPIPFTYLSGLDDVISFADYTESSGLSGYYSIVRGFITVSTVGELTVQFAQQSAVSAALYVGIGGRLSARYLGAP